MTNKGRLKAGVVNVVLSGQVGIKFRDEYRRNMTAVLSQVIRDGLELSCHHIAVRREKDIFIRPLGAGLRNHAVWIQVQRYKIRFNAALSKLGQKSAKCLRRGARVEAGAAKRCIRQMCPENTFDFFKALGILLRRLDVFQIVCVRGPYFKVPRGDIFFTVAVDTVTDKIFELFIMLLREEGVDGGIGKESLMGCGDGRFSRP